MTRRIPIQFNVANALQWLGTLYRSPADAIKEHVSNAIDEHLKAAERGDALERCAVVFHLERREVAIEYPYGMSREEFEAALRRVADSAKRMSEVAQIGQPGIGMFSFLQIGRKCTFLSRKNGGETIRVVLREGREDAEFDAALKRESLPSPGLRVVISELKVDPTKARGPLAPEKLTRLFSEKFGPYLQRGWLTIEVRSARLGYAALLIGKEAIAFNDRSGAADEQLEKLLSFHFRLRDRLQGADARAPGSGGRPRRRNPGA